MNFFGWPRGTHLIFEKLSQLDTQNESAQYIKKVKRCARIGIVYEIHKLDYRISYDLDVYYSYCPFCFLSNKKNCHFKDRSHYKHSITCYDCCIFKKKFSELNDTIYENSGTLLNIKCFFKYIMFKTI